MRPELVVDKGRGERMEISLNVTFPRVPCELLTLDVMDVSGELQMGVTHGINKVRLSPESEGSTVLSTTALDLLVACYSGASIWVRDWVSNIV